jgi:hypothetical protein
VRKRDGSIGLEHVPPVRGVVEVVGDRRVERDAVAAVSDERMRADIACNHAVDDAAACRVTRVMEVQRVSSRCRVAAYRHPHVTEADVTDHLFAGAVDVDVAPARCGAFDPYVARQVENLRAQNPVVRQLHVEVWTRRRSI